jgi:hypothetical protein
LTGAIPSEQGSTASFFGEQGHEDADSPMISVSSVDGVAAIDRFSTEIDRLNAASARPNPFLSSAFLRCYALRSEYHIPGAEERLYLVWDGGRLIGCAPMRRSLDILGPGIGPLRPSGTRLRVLAPFESVQPGVLSAPEDEERVAAALIRYFFDREKGWGLLEFVGQRPESALHKAIRAAIGDRFRVLEKQPEPYTEVKIVWESLRAYFRSLGKKRGNNVSRQARRLFAAGEPELVMADGAPAVTAWLEAYCDLDRRSWKRDTYASIQRHPRRMRFYREIAAGHAGLDPSFVGVLLDGVLIAGLIVGSNVTASPKMHGGWCLEMAYDRSRADLGPGQLLLLLAIGQAIERGDEFLNFMQNFAYYKHRWKAEPIDVIDIQVIRRMTFHSLRTSLGNLKRQWRSKRMPAAGNKPSGESDAGGKEGNEQDVSPQEQECARHLAKAALAYDGPGIRRFDRAQSRLHLPFDLE